MAEYIEREALLNTICKDWCNSEFEQTDGCNNCYFAEVILAAQSADVAPVRHGYWHPILHVGGKTDYECSCCLGIIADVPDDDEHDLCAWCSMCGAKMDGDG